MLKRIYTRALPGLQSDSVMLPLNPFRLMQKALDSVVAAWISKLSREPDFQSIYFGATFLISACIIPSSQVQEIASEKADMSDAEWIRADQSPGL